ncbi:kinase-like protein [Artomyces pyxidatus]|uniref:Kinase-like protein n=1 Tax=Artomyces pyxidatus TaxID=48021 RepID=A0ACB8SSS4_9AGAM|nr:kinase-like protein [Artomyces pyxidatus]
MSAKSASSLPQRALDAVRKQMNERKAKIQQTRPTTTAKENIRPRPAVADKQRGPSNAGVPSATVKKVRPVTQIASPPPARSARVVSGSPPARDNGVRGCVKPARTPSLKTIPPKSQFVAGRRISSPRLVPAKQPVSTSLRQSSSERSSLHRAGSAARRSTSSAPTLADSIASIHVSEGTTTNVEPSATKKSEGEPPLVLKAEAEEHLVSSEGQSNSSSSVPAIDDYVFLAHLGSGSFGEVKLAMRAKTKRAYAIKVVSKARLTERNMSAVMMLAEQKITREVSNVPFQLALKASFHDSANFYLVTEYCPSSLYDEWDWYRGHVPLHALKFWGAEIACGVHHLHSKGIIHRDLKLDNVLVRRDGHILIADFGLACHVKPEPASGTLGTWHYMAPEVWTGGSYSFEADWFAFGVILHLLHLSTFPWDGEDANEVRDAIFNVPFEFMPGTWTSMDCMYLIGKLLRLRPEARPNYRMIQRDEFFSDVDWARVNNGTSIPPFYHANAAPRVRCLSPPQDALESVGVPYPAAQDPHPEFAWVSPVEDDEEPIILFNGDKLDNEDSEEEFNYFDDTSESSFFLYRSPADDDILVQQTVRSLDLNEVPVYHPPDAWHSAFSRSANPRRTSTEVVETMLVGPHSIRSLDAGETPVLEVPKAWSDVFSGVSTPSTRSASPDTEGITTPSSSASPEPLRTVDEKLPVLHSVKAWWRRIADKM